MEKIELLRKRIDNIIENINRLQKEYKFTVYKRWVCNPLDPGKDGHPVPVCEFCKGLDGKEVLYTELWSHQAPEGPYPSSGKWYHGLEPGKVHKGCRCSYDIIIK